MSGADLVSMLKKSSRALVVGGWLAEDGAVSLGWEELAEGRRERDGGAVVVGGVGLALLELDADWGRMEMHNHVQGQ